jgi:hypothetical protein
MCGCSANFNGDERDIITQDDLSRDFDFTGNRPSIIEVGETWEDPSFDFTGNRPSIIEVGETWEDPSFDFLGRNRKAKKDLRAQGLSRKEARDVVKGKAQAPQLRTETTTQTEDDANKTMYGQGDWFSRNLIWIVLGVAVVGGGYYIYKKRK